MDVARHTPTRDNWTIANFLKLKVAQRESLRHELECSVCERKAFFRKPSRSGQGACFGAHHVDGCNMAAPIAQRIQDGVGGNENALENLGQHIVLDIAFGAAERINADIQEDAPDGRGGARRFVGQEARPNARNHRRLTPLLRTLIAHPEFADSDIAIEPPGAHARPAREFFVPLDQMAAHRGQLHGIWGVVDNARSRGDLYLNSGNKHLPSILVPENMKEALYARHGVDRSGQFHGSHVLIIGRPFVTNRGKTLCIPDTLDHIALIREQ